MNGRNLGIAWLTLAAFAAAPLLGCGSPGHNKQAVSGSVQLDEQPLAAGTIEFLETNDLQAMVGGALITEGGFDLKRDQGLPPGEYRVRIFSPDATATDFDSFGADGGQGVIRPAKEKIPARYNAVTELTCQVKKDATNHFEFQLQSR